METWRVVYDFCDFVLSPWDIDVRRELAQFARNFLERALLAIWPD
jgi:hypothetical protein